MEALIYIANCLYLISYLVQDMIRLRLLTLVAAFCLMLYFYTRPEPMLTVVCWNLVFIGLNVVQLMRLVVPGFAGRFRIRHPLRGISPGR